MAADRCFDRVLMDISDDSEELRAVVYRTASEAGLEERTNPLIFFVIPIHKAGDDTLKNPGQRYFAGFYEQMNVVGHQTVSNELKFADRFVFPQNCQKLAVIIFIFEYALLIYAAIDNMIDTERTDFAWTCWHRRDLFLS